MTELQTDDGIELSSPLESQDAVENATGSTIGRVHGLEPEPDTELDTDTTFELLKNHRRREVLRFLRATKGTRKLGEVAEFVAAKENGIEEAQLSSKQRKRVYVALYQCHLPMMDKAGVIDFNQPRGTLTLRPLANQLDQYLEAQGRVSEYWNQYLAVTLLGGLTYLFATLIIGPGSAFSTFSVFGMVSGLLILSTLDGRETIRSQEHGQFTRMLDVVPTSFVTGFGRLGGRFGGSNE